jgi:hypothetical protein
LSKSGSPRLFEYDERREIRSTTNADVGSEDDPDAAGDAPSPFGSPEAAVRIAVEYVP